jgi:putative transport protein
MGLILGRLGRTGPIIWEMPHSANLVLRQVGLVFFLAAIGTKAGYGFLDTLRAGGWMQIAGGIVITVSVSLLTLILGKRYLKLPMVSVMGMLAGIGTQPAVLAYANQQTESDHANTWYATVYPASMVSKIILAQLIVSMVLTR